MTLAEVHLPTLPVLAAGAACLLAMAWYWVQLARPDVPPARHIVRRLSLGFGVLAIAVAVFGFGIVDPDVRPMPYVLAWTIGAVALVMSVALAVVDALVSIGLHRRGRAAWQRESAERLVRAVKAARSARREGSR
jgi:peptidoglycan/LPS O-acetylase OafA/YrhL